MMFRTVFHLRFSTDYYPALTDLQCQNLPVPPPALSDNLPCYSLTGSLAARFSGAMNLKELSVFVSIPDDSDYHPRLSCTLGEFA